MAEAQASCSNRCCTSEVRARPSIDRRHADSTQLSAVVATTFRRVDDIAYLRWAMVSKRFGSVHYIADEAEDLLRSPEDGPARSSLPRTVDIAHEAEQCLGERPRVRRADLEATPLPVTDVDPRRFFAHNLVKAELKGDGSAAVGDTTRRERRNPLDRRNVDAVTGVGVIIRMVTLGVPSGAPRRARPGGPRRRCWHSGAPPSRQGHADRTTPEVHRAPPTFTLPAEQVRKHVRPCTCRENAIRLLPDAASP